MQTQNLSSSDPSDSGLHIIRIDDANKAIWRGDLPIEVTPQDYELLHYMYQRRGRLCTRRELVEIVLGGIHIDEYGNDLSRSQLNSAISRLRQKLEPDAANPIYILTVRGHGYKLA
jgi:DNA-binding response OmpR family regulator